MKKLIRYTAILPVTALTLVMGVAEPDSRTVAVMPFVTSAATCAPCHHEESPETKKPRKACDTYCRRCHTGMGPNHHPLAVRVRKAYNGMDLTTLNRVACFTCHNLELKRYDSEPWRAMSLYDSVFNRQKEYQTYFLPVKNNNGELCKKCH